MKAWFADDVVASSSFVSMDEFLASTWPPADGGDGGRGSDGAPLRADVFDVRPKDEEGEAALMENNPRAAVDPTHMVEFHSSMVLG